MLSENSIVQTYEGFIQTLTNGVMPLEYEQGSWLDLMAGKEIFEAISSQAFQVRDQTGNFQQGESRKKTIAKDLIRRLPIAQQPQDFQELVGLLADRLQDA